MGTVVSKRRSSEISESTAVKIRVVAAFQGNCKDNSRDNQLGDNEAQQSSSNVTESTAAITDHKTTQLKPSVANTKFPRGVYPQRESNLSLTSSKDDSHHMHDDNHRQPYRLKLGVLTNNETQLCSNPSHDHNELEELSQSTAVVQLQPGGEDHLNANQLQAGKIPNEFEWLLEKGVTPAELHTATTVIQKTVRGYQCRRKLAKEVKSAALIQRSFRQWRKNSSILIEKNDEQMFMPAHSIATEAPVDDSAKQPGVEHIQQFKKSKPLGSINEDTVIDDAIGNEQQTKTSSTSLTVATTDDDFTNKTNSDIATALKEVLNMVIPDSMVVPHFTDTQMPSGIKLTDMEGLRERTRKHLNTLCHSTIFSSARNKAIKIGEEQFKMYLEFQNEIDETMFLAQQKAELCLGESYIPRKVLLISSRVPKVTLLQCAILPDVITFVYDFERATYFELINKIANALDEYKQGAKIKNLGIICKGGPGHLYLFANKPVTPAKLFKDHKMMIFWKVMGAMMSKLIPEETVIHFMESNVDGNKQGEQLLKDLEKLMYPSKVNITCPLEISATGQLMISTYFHPPKYRMWKQKRYTKLKLY